MIEEEIEISYEELSRFPLDELGDIHLCYDPAEKVWFAETADWDIEDDTVVIEDNAYNIFTENDITEYKLFGTHNFTLSDFNLIKDVLKKETDNGNPTS